MEKMKNYIVGLGEVLWDIELEDKKEDKKKDKKKDKKEDKKKDKTAGGAPANFANHVSQLGFDSLVISAVGEDPLGQELLEQLKPNSEDEEKGRKDIGRFIQKIPPSDSEIVETGTVLVQMDAKGSPTYEIIKNVAWDNIDFTSELCEIAKHTKAVTFGTLAQRNKKSRKTINAFLNVMPDDDTLKIFDINLRQKFYSETLIDRSLKKCSVLKINDEELVTISDMFSYPGLSMIDKCWVLMGKYNLKILILTCGSVGSYVFTPNLVSFQKTPKVTVVDTVGAGDAFSAAFCAAFLKGKGIVDAHKFAVKVAAFVCKHKGATPKLPQDLIDELNTKGA